MHILSADTIDFRAYTKDTEGSEKVRPASAYVQELIDNLGKQSTEIKSLLPWEKTHPLFQFRPGEVTLWAGVNGHGKSLVTGMASMSLCTQGEKVCIASFEMKPRKTLERMARQWSGEAPSGEWMENAEVIESFRDLYSQFKEWSKDLWLYDQQGTVDSDLLIGVVRYAATELKVTHFVIDSLMKCVQGEDDYNGQKSFLDRLTSLARDLNIHIHLVHHIRKLENEGKTPDKTDVKGSGSITDQVDNVLMVWRNKPKEKDIAAGKKTAFDDPDALLICDKQRNGEWEGRIALWYDKASQQFVASPGAVPLTLYNWPHWRS